MRRAALFSGLVPGFFLILLLGFSISAHADVFGPISLVSGSTAQQADYAHDPAISEDGRYVAWDGSFAGQPGVYRTDLITGAVEQVAGGDAELPSISENGSYVSFTTRQSLVPGDRNEGPDVYVRDMEVPCRLEDGSCQPCTEEEETQASEADEASHCPFVLASAVDGSEEALTYATTEPELHGSVASGRSALSADGREVAFVTTAVSNLTDPSATSTPAQQVAVRYLDTKTTELVSVAREVSTGRELADVPVSGKEGTGTYGAVYAGPTGDKFVTPGLYELTDPSAASISADGSTVAWLGQSISAQAPTLAGESLKLDYTEPLWRRIADGGEAPTRRITGGSDPTNAACVASGETKLQQPNSLADPCQGPFMTQTGQLPGTWESGATGDVVPQLSADGYTVAFLASAPLLSLGEDFGETGESRPSDLYVANMHEGLSRIQALTPLTELASGNSGDVATDAPIVDLGISPNASEVAFTTERTVFPLGSPALISAPAPEPGMTELFDVDLNEDTLTRVTQGFEGGPSERPHKVVSVEFDPYGRQGDGALSPSFSGDGALLAFSSTASNLVYGDGNTPPLGAEPDGSDGSDAFLVERETFTSSPAPQQISSAPAGPPLVPAWRLGVTAHSRRNGSVVLDVLLPAAGTLRAVAQGAVVLRAFHEHTQGRDSSKRSEHASATAVATRTLATAVAHAGTGSLMTLTLAPAARYKSLAARRGGLSAIVSLTFTTPGRPTLHERIAVTFVRTIKRSPKPKSKASAQQ
jgi:hypothetical protein